jgi:hypothetical protein
MEQERCGPGSSSDRNPEESPVSIKATSRAEADEDLRGDAVVVSTSDGTGQPAGIEGDAVNAVRFVAADAVEAA